MFPRIRNRIALLLRGSRFRKELDEEMAFLVGALALFSAVASFVPAARIGRMDPAEILREG